MDALPQFDPKDWESQALFPARLLVGFPPEVQQKLQQAGAELYLLILENQQEAPEATMSPVAREVRSLLEELLGLVHTSRTIEGLEEVTESLEEIVREAAAGLIAAGQDPPEESPEEEGREPVATHLRPFLRDMVTDPRHYRAVTDLGEGLAAVPRQPTPWQWPAALTMDLVWIKTVLEKHIASRGEVSALQTGDSALCTLAGRIGAHLQEPLEMLSEIVRLAQQEEATGGTGG